MVMNKSKKDIYQSLIFFAGDNIYTDIKRDSNPNFIRVCDESAIKLLKNTIKTLIVVVGSMNMYLGFPMFSYTFHNDLQLPIPVLLPFTDDESSVGLLVNFLNQIFVAGIGLSGNIGLEIITCILKNNIWVSTVAIGHSVDEYTQEIIENKNKDRFTDRVFNVLEFRNILIQVQDLDR